MVLCDQGCGAKILWINGIPINESDGKTNHKETCMTLKYGKWMAGVIDTIPMANIRTSIEQSYQSVISALDTEKVSDMMNALHTSRQLLDFVIVQMVNQSKWNARQRAEFEEYKTVLVQQQALREERKRLR